MQLLKNTLGKSANRIVLFSVVRNVEHMLAFFVAYYRRLGVSDFVIIDNDSSDQSLPNLLSLDVPAAIYSCRGSYRDANYGTDWIYALLEAHGREKWCVVADADELLVYDGCETKRLPAFVDEMENAGQNALYAYLVDMYGADKTAYQTGESFVKHCPFYDRLNDRYYTLPRGNRSLYGGLRRRLAGVECCLEKIPLFRWTMREVRLGWGCHFWRDATGKLIRAPMEVIPHPRRGALLHFKFLYPDLESMIRARIAADQNWNHCAEYRAYEAARIWDLPFFDEKYSGRFQSSQDLRPFFDFDGFHLVPDKCVDATDQSKL